MVVDCSQSKPTHVIVHVLTTDVQKRMREVGRGHRQAVVKGPQRRSETSTDTGEATARRRVSLEHDERLAGLLSNLRGVDVLPDHVPACAVIEELGELGLGVDGVTKTFV